MANAKVTLLLDMKSRLGGMNSAISRAKALGATLTKMMLPLTGVAGAGGIAYGIKNIIHMGAELDHLKHQTGVAVKDLIILRQTFEDNGVSADNSRLAINKMQKSIVEAGQGLATPMRALDGLNLEVAELLNMSPAEQFSTIGNAISGIENPAERSAIAMQIFGRSGAELQGIFATGDIQEVAESMGRMPEIMQRNSVEFERVDTLLGRMPNKTKQLFVGIGDQIISHIRAPLEALNKIDLTGMGQRIGAYLSLGLESLQDGTFSKFISLSIQAGFEWGVDKVKSNSPQWMASFAKTAFSAIATLGIEISKLLIDAFGTPIAGLSAGFQWLFETAGRWATEFALKLQNKILDAFMVAQVYNPLVSAEEYAKTAAAVNAVQKANRKELENTKGAARSLGEVYSANKATMSEISDLAGDYLDNGLKEGLAVLGIQTDELDKQKSASEQLNELILDRIGLKKKEKDAEGGAVVTKDSGGPTTISTKKNFADLLQERYDQFTGANPDGTKYEGDRGDFGVKTWDAAKASMMDYAMSVGTIGQQVYTTIGSIAASFASGVSNSIQELIKGTMTLKDALQNIATSVIDSVIKAFADMAAQWMTKQVMMFALGQKLKAADTASTIAKGATETAAMEPPATLASIASFGAAAIIGIAAIHAALGGFANGGMTGSGGTYDVKGLVHANEWVSPEWMTKHPQWGPVIAGLESVRSKGYASGGYTSGLTAAFSNSSMSSSGIGGEETLGLLREIAAKNNQTNVAVVDSDKAATRYVSSRRGQRAIIGGSDRRRRAERRV